jgi:hypothetical protein
MIIIAGLGLALAGPSASAQEKLRQSFTAFAVAMGTSNPPVLPAGRTATLQITITRWTTDEERVALLSELVENGQEGLVKSLQDQDETGFVRVTTPSARRRSSFPSERLRYAREFPRDDGGRRIVLALDRYISFYEAASMPRWRDYDVTLIVMDLDAEGNGEGQLAMGVRLAINDQRQLVIENFGTEPVRLTRIRMNK